MIMSLLYQTKMYDDWIIRIFPFLEGLLGNKKRPSFVKVGSVKNSECLEHQKSLRTQRKLEDILSKNKLGIAIQEETLEIPLTGINSLWSFFQFDDINSGKKSKIFFRAPDLFG